MNSNFRFFSVLTGCLFILLISCKEQSNTSVTVPFILDHNRMIVDAEIKQYDGVWRKVRLWIDSGNPELFISEELAIDLGLEITGAEGAQEAAPLEGVRIGNFSLNLDGVKTKVMSEPYWLFSAMHIDGNLPSTVLKNYNIVFDYPARIITIAETGILEPRGIEVPAVIHSGTGIVQIDAVIEGDSLSFALDNGASYSFANADVIETIQKRMPSIPQVTGTTGCANMWGWWPPQEYLFQVCRLPKISWGTVLLTDAGIVGVPHVPEYGPSLGEWYSMKTARPVAGFIGANALLPYRVEIDYANSVVYFKKERGYNPFDMDVVGISLRQDRDGNYIVVGIVQKEGIAVVEGVESGDMLLKVDGLETKGKTFGTVMDALRGEPGDVRIVEVERNGERIKIAAEVKRLF